MLKPSRTTWTMLALVAAAGLGCGEGVSPDASPVLANVGGEKITEREFQAQVKSLYPAEAELILGSRENRGQLLGRMATTKQMVRFGQMEGLDRDPKVQLMLEEAKAQIYFKALAEKRTAEPTEAELKAFYDKVAAQRKTQAEGLPAYDMVKAQLVGAVKQQKAQELAERVLAEAKTKVALSISDYVAP